MAGGKVNLAAIRKAQEQLWSSGEISRTPLLPCVQSWFPGLEGTRLYFKLENLQSTGSFKIRGVINQLHNILEDESLSSKKLLTISAGNYGKAFAIQLASRGLSGLCIMPDTAPDSRAKLIESYGLEVERQPSDNLQATVDAYVKEKDCHFVHPFDDPHLIAGYGSVGLEILEELPAPDVVAVCCGGGGLVAGIAAAIKLSGFSHCRVYAVEPEGAPTMSESFKEGKAMSLPGVHSIASGLAPPYAGQLPYTLCWEFIAGVVLISDEEIVQTVRRLYDRGLVVEPSGAAAVAAVLGGHIPDIAGKSVVAVVTGGNITLTELTSLIGADGPSS